MMVEKICILKLTMKVCILIIMKIWNRIKKTLNARFHSQPTYDDKYIKTKVKTFSCAINTLFSDNKILKGGNHNICIAAICVFSILKMDKKNYPQVYLERC